MTTRRLVITPPAEQTYADLVLFDDQPDEGGEFRTQLALDIASWVGLGSPEVVDVTVTVPDRVGP